MKNFKQIALVAVIIVSSAFAMEKVEQPLIWQGAQPTFQGIPKDVQAIIMSMVKEAVVTDGLDQTLKNITNFALINKDFRNFLNQPENLKWLISTISTNSATTNFLLPSNFWMPLQYVAEHLRNMPGMQHPEMQKWVNSLALLDAIEQHKGLDEVKKLIAAGADVNFIRTWQNGQQMTALLYAIRNNNIELLQWLLKAGANVNALNGKALMLAAKHGNLDVVQELLKYNPDLTFKNNAGQTALDLAVDNGHQEIADLIRAKEAEYKAHGK